MENKTCYITLNKQTNKETMPRKSDVGQKEKKNIYIYIYGKERERENFLCKTQNPVIIDKIQFYKITFYCI